MPRGKIVAVTVANSLKIRSFSMMAAIGLGLLSLLHGAPAAAQEATTRAAVSPDYRIGPGDSLHIFVFENDQLSVTVPVRPDGKISTPLVEDMVAVGKTPSQLARDIEVALGKYVKTPKVNVEVLTALERLQPGQGHRSGEGAAGDALSRRDDGARGAPWAPRA